MSKRWDLIPQDSVLIKKKDIKELTSPKMWLKGRLCEDFSQKAAIYKPGGEPSQGIETACTLILDFSVSTAVKKTNFCCLSHPNCGILLWQPKLRHCYITSTCCFIIFSKLILILKKCKQDSNMPKIEELANDKPDAGGLRLLPQLLGRLRS